MSGSGLTYGSLKIKTPVVLAPMAGITNTAFRRLCREFGGGLYVSEMVTSRALVERTEESLRLVGHHESEDIRSVQLYGVDPKTISQAVTMLVAEDRADHIDLNFGCPVPKVTRKGGGAALPWKQDLFSSIVTAAVRAAGDVPVTVKMRKGIDQDHLTFLDAGKSARDAGVAAVALHGRTASDYYSGNADWNSIAQLREALPDVQVLGNGDIWSAGDAIRMMRETGVDGVVVGRGCLGRPWLFGDLQAAFEEYQRDPNSNAAIEPIQPTLGEVAQAFKRHTELLVEFFESEERACRDIRKHVAWYFKGYPVGGEFRAALAKVTSLDHMDAILATLDWSSPYPGDLAEGPRGRLGGAKSCSLPENWLLSRELEGDQRTMLNDAEINVSGG
ncbi:tRNA dihydrouridine synthase DusB [Candidatus Rhodoluna planktonica]|uniref:tRNA-dihydrouridine synthase n=1 Tax=Candidatus Rhodoluna planktonica TaxID=535712 RepID=A0A1D9DYT9_9MICO|nr:tRNA dihydrouridine synthase DusB [Candidatus Rhodoluna planktonica]AOY55965.1 tRNA-dihydrouridine synthase [Candidatus Rhodoluna planktonica]